MLLMISNKQVLQATSWCQQRGFMLGVTMVGRRLVLCSVWLQPCDIIGDTPSDFVMRIEWSTINDVQDAVPSMFSP